MENQVSINSIKLAKVSKDIEYIKDDISELKVSVKDISTQMVLFYEKMEETFVTQREFKPVRNIVFGATGMMLTMLFSAIIMSVIGL